jgi:pimeloyl-ACP methyl ester carboxylesterase
MNQGIFWYDGFCQALAAGGARVIRYDHRDTGASDTVNWSQAPYDLTRLTTDAISILDAVGVPSAHVVGLSMGGYIGQLLALDHADRVRSLTLMSSTPDHRPYLQATMGIGRDRFALPPPRDELLAYLRKLAIQPPVSPSAWLATTVEAWRIAVGPTAPFDRQFWTGLVGRSFARTRSPLSPFNHLRAVALSPSRTARLGSIRTATLIIHGTEDPHLPLPHGQALAAGIPEARLTVIDGMGHIFPPEWSAVMAERILDHVLN